MSTHWTHRIPLLSSSSSDDALEQKVYSDELQEEPEPLAASRPRLPRVIVLALCVSALVNVLLLGCLYVLDNRLSRSVPWRGTKPLYSPAKDIIWHENIVSAKVYAKTKWHGPPSPEVDAAWEGIYQAGISSVPKEQARLIANRSLPFYGDKNNYQIQLEVFHVLHCLNNIRKAVYPEYYPPNPMRWLEQVTDEGEIITVDHFDHCINSIREALMCNADLTPGVWQWSPRENRAKLRFDALHTCVNWDSLYAWAEEKTPKIRFNVTEHVLDDLHFSDD